MAEVGQFRVVLIGDTAKFSKPMQDATKQAEVFSKSVNITTASTELHSAALSRASAVNVGYSGATGVASASSFGLAAAAGKARPPVIQLTNALQGASQHSASASAAFATSAGALAAMERTANQSTERNKQLDKSLRSISAQSDLAAGKIGTIGYALRLNSRPLTHFDVLIRNNVQGSDLYSRALDAAHRAAIGFGIGAGKLTGHFISLSTGLLRGAGSIRNWLVNLQPATSAIGKVRIQTEAFTKYLKGVFGPVLTDIGVVGSTIGKALALALSPIAPTITAITSRTVQWAQGLFSVTKNGAGMRSIPTFINQIGAAFYKVGQFFPRWQSSFDKIGISIQLFASKTITWLNAIKGPLGSLTGFLRDFGQRFALIFTTIGNAAQRGIQAITTGFQKAVPYLTAFSNAIGYVGREVTKGVATFVRMSAAVVTGIGFVAKLGAAFVTTAAKTVVFGASLLRGSGFVGGLITKLGLLGLSMTGLPFAGLLAKLHSVTNAIPLVVKVFGAFQSVLGAVGKAINVVVGKLALIGTVLTGGILAAGGALALLAKAGFSAGQAAAQLSDKIGVSTENLIGLQHAAKLAGVQDFDNKLKGLNATLQGTKTLEELGKGESLPALSQSLMEAGLSIEDLRAKSPDQALGDIADAMQNMGSHADRVRLATHLFGEEGVRMAAMLKDGRSGLAAASEEAKKLGLSMSRVDAAMIEQANLAVSRLKDLFIGVGRQIAVRVAPFIEVAVNRITAFGTAGEGATGIVSAGFNLAGRAVTFVLNAVDWTINKFFVAKQAVLEFAASATSGFANLLSSADWMAEWIDYGIEKFGEFRISIMEMFAGIFDGMAKIASLLPDLPEWLGGGKIIDPQAFTGIADSFRDTAKVLEDELNSREKFSFKGAADSINRLSGSLKKIADDTGKQLQERMAGPSLADRFGTMMDGISKDARARAEETARLAAEGSAGILDAAAEKAEEKNNELKRTMFSELSAGEALLEGSREAFALHFQNTGEFQSSRPNSQTVTKVAQDMEKARAEVANRVSNADAEAPKQTAVLRQILAAIQQQNQRETVQFVQGTI